MSTHLDARSPLVIDTHELARHPGAHRQVTETVACPADVKVGLIGVPEGAGLDLDLNLEAVVEGVLVTGTVHAPLEGECARCLDPVHDEGDYTITELYNYPGREAGEDELFLEEELLDLEPAIRSAIVLELPFSPLCKPDCAGLCPVCGANLNDEPDHHHDEPTDPRWAKLASLVDAQNDGDEAASEPTDND